LDYEGSPAATATGHPQGYRRSPPTSPATRSSASPSKRWVIHSPIVRAPSRR